MTLQRFTLTGTLITDSELHVGGLGGTALADRHAARDGQGRLVIPGTSLAGVLRSWFPTDWATRWFGWAEGDHGGSSAVWVDDAVHEPRADRRPTAIRSRTSIERQRGAALDGGLFSLETVCRGERFRFRIRVDAELGPPGSDRHDEATDVVARLSGLLRDGLTVGAAGGAGAGRLKADGSVRVELDDLSTPTGLLSFLGGARYTVPVQDVEHDSAPSLSAKASWRPRGPILVAERYTAEHDADRGPIWFHVDDHLGRFLIPGSSVRGALRSHAELICRTVLGIERSGLVDVPRATDRLRAEQITVGAFPPLLRLFGGPVYSEGKARLFRGRISVEDVVSATFDAEKWQAVLRATKRPPRRSQTVFAEAPSTVALDEFNESNRSSRNSLWVDLAVRNSIDRWTGAVVSQALYGSLEVFATRLDAWSPITVSYRGDTDSAEDLAALGLLQLVLEDLTDGWIPLGAGTTRGLGAIECAPVTLLSEHATKEAAEAWRASVAAHRRERQE